MALTQVQYGMTDAGLQNTTYHFKNRVINGDMRIDQRNSGNPVTANGAFAVDRFGCQITYGAFSLQQSSTAPAGFSKSLSVTVTTASASPASTDRNCVSHNIEGYNVSDLGWGTSAAQPITFSFWVRSSLTGTFSGSISSDTNPSYVYTYTINTPNTWEYKTITVPGPTIGTWNTTNGMGLSIRFDMGTGTDRQTSAVNTWVASDYRSATGSVRLTASVGSTWYVTGVQVEKGSTATSFDFLPYGLQLALCQRYYQQPSFFGVASTTGEMGVSIAYKTTMRISPSLITDLRANATYSGTSNTLTRIGVGGVSVGAATTASSLNSDFGMTNMYMTGLVAGAVYAGSCIVNAEF